MRTLARNGLTSNPKAWQTSKRSFTNDESFKNFFSRFQILDMLWRKFQRMIFYPPLTSLGEKPRNVCFQLPLHEKDHQQLLYQFLDQLRHVCILLWICFVNLFTVWMSDIAWTKWVNSSFCFFIEILSSQISVNGIGWIPRTWCTVPISYSIFCNIFSLLNKWFRYTCWYILCPA